MICAAIFLVSIDLSWNALCTTGIIRAREGASIKCTNFVSSKDCRDNVVFLVGFCRASNKVGTMARNGRNTIQYQNLQNCKNASINIINKYKLPIQKCHYKLKCTLNFRVLDNRTNLPQGLLSSFLHFQMRVCENFTQLGHNVW